MESARQAVADFHVSSSARSGKGSGGQFATKCDSTQSVAALFAGLPIAAGAGAFERTAPQIRSGFRKTIVHGGRVFPATAVSEKLTRAACFGRGRLRGGRRRQRSWCRLLRGRRLRRFGCRATTRRRAAARRGRFCRRLPPTRHGFPRVFEDSWCGCYRFNEALFGTPPQNESRCCAPGALPQVRDPAAISRQENADNNATDCVESHFVAN